MGTVTSLLAEHVSFRCTSVDRIGIRGYVPGLQYEGGVVKFLVHRGYTIPSPAVLAVNRDRLVSDLDGLLAESGVPMVRFGRGESKEDLARPYQDDALAAGRFGLVLVGKAQERTSSWRGFVDKTHASHRPGHPHFTWRRQSSVPDHWYFYFADDEWGPAFIKLCTYAPIRCGRARTAMSGPSANSPRLGSGSRRSTTVSARWRTPRRRTGSAPASAPATSGIFCAA